MTSSNPADNSSTKRIILKTADDEVFEVEEAVAMELGTVKAFFDDNLETVSSRTEIPLPNVTAEPLSKIIAYCKEHLKDLSETDRKANDAKFVEELSKEELMEVIVATNYLNVKYLLDVLCQAAADLIKNKSVEFVRNLFGIENDFLPEEEAALRQENAWCFEGVDED